MDLRRLCAYSFDWLKLCSFDGFLNTRIKVCRFYVSPASTVRELLQVTAYRRPPSIVHRYRRPVRTRRVFVRMSSKTLGLIERISSAFQLSLSVPGLNVKNVRILSFRRRIAVGTSEQLFPTRTQEIAERKREHCSQKYGITLTSTHFTIDTVLYNTRPRAAVNSKDKRLRQRVRGIINLGRRARRELSWERTSRACVYIHI